MPDARGTPLRGAACMLLCAAVSTVVFWPATSGEFVWDDRLLILDQEAMLESWSRSLRAFSEPVTGGYYRPVLIASLSLDHHLFGADPEMFHRTNVLLHALNAALVWLLVFRLTRRLAAATLGALVFAVHPIQAQAVALITGRNDLLLLAPFVGALAIYRRWGTRWAPFAVVSLLYGLVLFTKEVGIVLPAVLLASDVLVGRCKGGDLRRRLAWMVVLGGVAVAWLALRADVLGAVGAAGEVYRAESLDIRLRQVVATFGYYVGHVFVPAGFSVTPYHDGMIRPLGGSFLLHVALCAAFGVSVVGAWRRRPVWAFGLLFFLLTVLPVLGWVPMKILMLEHRLYVPMVGMGVLAGAVWLDAYERFAVGGSRKAVVAVLTLAAVAWVGASALATTRRVPTYRDELSLWEEAVRRVPQSAYARHEYGYALAEAGRDREAIEQLREALRLEPTHARARHKLALALDRTGRSDAAIAELERLVGDHPGYVEGHNALGVLQAQAGDPRAARSAFAAGLEHDPDNVRILGNLAQILVRIGERQEAVEVYRRLTVLRPGDPKILERFARTLLDGDRPAEAADVFRAALRMRPDSGSLHAGLGLARFRSGDLEGALSHARRARDLGHEDEFVRHVLEVYGRSRP